MVGKDNIGGLENIEKEKSWHPLLNPEDPDWQRLGLQGVPNMEMEGNQMSLSTFQNPELLLD